MGWNKEDEATLLEGETLELIRTQGIFLVLSIAIFSFSERGKVFSLISLIISLAINTLLLGNYYVQRSRIAKLGKAPRKTIDIIAMLMVVVFFFTLWILYEVWNMEPAASLVKLAEDIEDRIDVANQRQIEENRKIIQDLASLGATSKTQTPTAISKKAALPHHFLNIEVSNRNRKIVNNAALASVA